MDNEVFLLNWTDTNSALGFWHELNCEFEDSMIYIKNMCVNWMMWFYTSFQILIVKEAKIILNVW